MRYISIEDDREWNIQQSYLTDLEKLPSFDGKTSVS